MLREILIKNFVLIEDLRLEFDKGLNVLTGETGAGKTIVLDALSLLLGDRFQSEQVRQGAGRASVDGIFDAPKARDFQTWWADHGFEKADELLIRREGFPDGRSKAYLNDRPVTLGTLQELGGFLVDVHGQNEHVRLLKPAVQLELLDLFGGLEAERAALAPLYHTWKDLEEKRREGQLSEEERARRLEIGRFQLEEIDKAQLKAGEEEAIALRLPELKNAEKLRALGGEAYGHLYMEEGSALERLGQAARALENLKRWAPAAEPLVKEIEECKSRLEEAALGLQRMAESWQSDPAALEELLNRLDLLAKLKKKYGGTVEEVLERAGRLRQELDLLENAESYRQELDRAAQAARLDLEKGSLALSAKRKQAAENLSAAVKKELGDLGLKRAVFRVAVETIHASSPLVGEDRGGGKLNPNPPSQPSPTPPRLPGGSAEATVAERGEGGYTYSLTGIDRAVFEWAPNPGEGMQPLKAIASGGEMSRVMLAVKSVLAETDAMPTLVFDEIDAGIGGLTAQAVGRKLRKLSRRHQTLCVSHLPQIASCAAAHFQISKRVAKSRTFAVVVRLDGEARLDELARLLGSQITPTSRQHAKELLVQNQS